MLKLDFSLIQEISSDILKKINPEQLQSTEKSDGADGSTSDKDNGSSSNEASKVSQPSQSNQRVSQSPSSEIESGNLLKDTFYLGFYESYRDLKAEQERQEDKEADDKEEKQQKSVSKNVDGQGKGKEKKKEKEKEKEKETDNDDSKAGDTNAEFNKAIEIIRQYSVSSEREGLEKCIALFTLILKAVQAGDKDKELLIKASKSTLEKVSDPKKLKELSSESILPNLIIALYLVPLKKYDPSKVNELIVKLEIKGKELKKNGENLSEILLAINNIAIGFFIDLYQEKLALENKDNKNESKSALELIKGMYFSFKTSNKDKDKGKDNKNESESTLELMRVMYLLFKTLRNTVLDNKADLKKEVLNADNGLSKMGYSPTSQVMFLTHEDNVKISEQFNFFADQIIAIQKNNKKKLLDKNEAKRLHRYFYTLRIMENHLCYLGNVELYGEIKLAFDNIDDNCSTIIKANLQKHLDNLNKFPQEIQDLERNCRNLLNEKNDHIENGNWRIRYAKLLSDKLSEAYPSEESSKPISKKSQKTIWKHLLLLHRCVNSADSPLCFYDPRLKKYQRLSFFEQNLIQLTIAKHKAMYLLAKYRKGRARSILYAAKDFLYNNINDNVSKDSRVNMADALIKELKKCEGYEDYQRLLEKIAKNFNDIPDRYSNLRNMLREIAENIYQTLNYFIQEEASIVKQEKQSKAEGSDPTQSSQEKPSAEKKEEGNVRKVSLNIVNQIFNVILIENLSLSTSPSAYNKERITFEFIDSPRGYFEKIKNKYLNWRKNQKYNDQTQNQYVLIKALNHFMQAKYNEYIEPDRIAEFYTKYIEYCSIAIINITDPILKERLLLNRQLVIDRFLALKFQTRWPHFTNEQLKRIDVAIENSTKKKNQQNSQENPILNSQKASYESLISTTRTMLDETLNKEQKFEEFLKLFIVAEINASKVLSTGKVKRAPTMQEQLIDNVKALGKNIPFNGGVVVDAVGGAAQIAISNNEDLKNNNVAGASGALNRDTDDLTDATAKKITLMYSYYIKHVVEAIDLEELAKYASKRVVSEMEKSGVEGDIPTKSNLLANAVLTGSGKFSMGGLLTTAMRVTQDSKIKAITAEDLFKATPYFIVIDEQNTISYRKRSNLSESDESQSIQKNGFIVLRESQLPQSLSADLVVVGKEKFTTMFKEGEQDAFEGKIKQMNIAIQNSEKPQKEEPVSDWIKQNKKNKKNKQRYEELREKSRILEEKNRALEETCDKLLKRIVTLENK